MKRAAELDYKTIPIAKSRDKIIRSRNKRKCKRKKNARTANRYCTMKESFLDNTTNERPCGFLPGLATASQKSPRIQNPRSSEALGLRLKHEQNVWIRTYQRIVKWHSKHQMNYWKLCAQRLKAENDQLKRQMLGPYANGYVQASVAKTDIHKHDLYGDTDDDSSDDCSAIGENSIGDDEKRRALIKAMQSRQAALGCDEEFLAFMEISARHRLEHRRLKNETVY